MSVNSKATGLKSAQKKYLYEKSKLGLLDLGRSAILPISRKVLYNLCNNGLAKHNHFNTHIRPFKRPRGKKEEVELTQIFVSSSTNCVRKVSYGNLQTINTELVKQEQTKYLSIGYIII